MSFSRRSDFDGRLNRLTRAAEGVADLVDLTVSNPTRVGLPLDAAVFQAALAPPGVETYAPEPFGLPTARAAIAARYPGVAPWRVVLTASTSEAYGFLFKLLGDPGDAVLSTVPGYPLFEQLARYEGLALRPVPLGFDGAWYLDAHALAAAQTPRTRAVLVVSPNNPTGQYLHRGELAALAAQGLPLIVDEVFADYPLDAPPDAVRRLTDHPEVRGFALGGLSKSAGLPQLKLGWIVVNGPAPWAREALRRLELIADTWLSVGAAVQRGLPGLLRLGLSRADAIRARCRRNLDHLRGVVRGTACTVPPVEGGWYAPVALPAIRDEEAWALACIQGGVRVQPGYFYDAPFGTRVVLSLLTPGEAFSTGVSRLLHVVATA